MRKSKEQIEAERIVAIMLRELTPEEMLDKARKIANEYKFAIAQRYTVGAMLANLWDMWEDFDEAGMHDVFENYLAYHKSFAEGNEQVYHQLLEVNKILGGDLFEGKMLRAILMESMQEGIKADLNEKQEEGQ